MDLYKTKNTCFMRHTLNLIGGLSVTMLEYSCKIVVAKGVQVRQSQKQVQANLTNELLWYGKCTQILSGM